ncbi:MAG TPA: hypothetical protein DCM68_01800 [Verrucomicrobia bacterium]|nr:hypothetical protein [Verrucomicrobiota bacterium]
MADKRQFVRSESKTEDERGALKTFEQILEVMPDDRSTLEAAILAAQACGEAEIARTHRLHLADILRMADDADALQKHLEALRNDPDPRAQEWIAAFDAGFSVDVSPAEDLASLVEPPQRRGPPPSSEFNISEEIDLAWRLFEHQEIDQEEYAALVRDLTEMSASPNRGTVSVLHALEASHHQNLDRCLAFLAQGSEGTPVPYISLSGFTMRPELAKILPDAFMANRGAIVFEVMGHEWLVAVLNPFSLSLRADIQNLCGFPCHFYLARASDFDQALARLRKTASDSDAQS